MRIITRADWRARPPARRYVPIAHTDRPGMEGHHSVGMYGHGANDPWGFARAVQNDHMGRGWTDIFYNACIWFDGQILELRPWHVKSGPIRSFTVCFPGNTSTAPLTAAQKDTWRKLRADRLAKGVGRPITWHRQRAATGCPGTDAVRFLSSPDARAVSVPAPTEEDDSMYTIVSERGTTHKWAVGGTVVRAVNPDMIRQMKVAGLVRNPEQDPDWPPLSRFVIDTLRGESA